MKFGMDVANRLEDAIFRTWDQIAPDVFQIFNETGEQLTNIDALEFCIDADRLLLNGGDAEANEIVKQLCVEHGYKKVLNFLNTRFLIA